MSILKIDIDVKMSKDLLYKWVKTRELMAEWLGYPIIRMPIAPTEKGYHVWVHFRETLSDTEMAELQFLLGDDQKRCRFNFLRNEAGVFKTFNALFSKKLQRKHRGLHECSEPCLKLGYCPYFVTAPDWCGRNTEARP